MQVYKLNSLIPFEFKVTDDESVTFFISPLSYVQKMSLQEQMIKATSGNMVAAMDVTRVTMQMCLKKVEGLKYGDEIYKLNFGNDGLSEECLDDLLNLPFNGALTQLCSSLVNGIPHRDTLPQGVSFMETETEKK